MPLFSIQNALAIFIEHQNLPQIFEVERSLPLSDKEPVFTNYYVDAGTEGGLQPGWLVNIYRRKEFYFPNKSGLLAFQTSWFPVGEALVIFARKNLSVLRTHKIYSGQKSEFSHSLEALLIHDRLDLHSLRPVVKASLNLLPELNVQDIETEL